MLKRTSLIAACLAMLFVAVGAKADSWDMKTTVTFTQAVELPGDTVLPAGTYVFKLGDVSARRDVVLVYNAEQDHLFATIFAIPQRRITPVEKSYMGFEERGAGMPSALHEWYFPGNFGGIEFVYR
ncbi:MAG TPA: hypothetical protein VK789_05430 [Bryobacteraceae bacterium]|nr:hypothetical protein [Bryobacteraceae bacterium]